MPDTSDGLGSVKRILQIDAQVGAALSDRLHPSTNALLYPPPLVLGTYFAYYYLYRHRAQQTCRPRATAKPSLRNNVQSSAYFRKDAPLSKPVVSRTWECNQGLGLVEK